jgi:hypothetical protein
VHRVDVEIFGARSESIEFLSPQDGSDVFPQTSFDASGAIERGTGRFDDDGRYLNDPGGARAVVTFPTSTSMSAKWELQKEDGLWVPWMDVRFTRLGDPHVEVRSKDDHSV